MGTQSEILRAASLLVEEYGEMAPAGAFLRADMMHHRGDQPGRRVWLRVGHAAEALLADRAPTGTVLH